MVEKIVDLIKVSKHFGQVRALNHVSFWLKKGEIFGYVGPNGAGKTTTIRVLCGLLRPDEGYVKLFGADPRAKGERRRRLIEFYRRHRFKALGIIFVKK